MRKSHGVPVMFVASLICTPVVCAEPTRLKCEAWHPRLGQNADKSFAIDLAARTCAGQPCSISDVEFKWQEQGGRYTFAMNRKSGEGTLVYQGELLFSYKNCALAPGN